MDRQRRRESWTSEVPNNIQDTRLVGGLPDEATQVRTVKLPVLTGCSGNNSMQFQFFRRR